MARAADCRLPQACSDVAGSGSAKERRCSLLLQPLRSGASLAARTRSARYRRAGGQPPAGRTGGSSASSSSLPGAARLISMRRCRSLTLQQTRVAALNQSPSGTPFRAGGSCSQARSQPRTVWGRHQTRTAGSADPLAGVAGLSVRDLSWGAGRLISTEPWTPTRSEQGVHADSPHRPVSGLRPSERLASPGATCR